MLERLSHWQAEMQIVVCACCYKFKMTMETLRSARIQLTVQSTWSQLEAPLTIRTPYLHPPPTTAPLDATKKYDNPARRVNIVESSALARLHLAL